MSHRPSFTLLKHQSDKHLATYSISQIKPALKNKKYKHCRYLEIQQKTKSCHTNLHYNQQNHIVETRADAQIFGNIYASHATTSSSVSTHLLPVWDRAAVLVNNPN